MASFGGNHLPMPEKSPKLQSLNNTKPKSHAIICTCSSDAEQKLFRFKPVHSSSSFKGMPLKSITFLFAFCALAAGCAAGSDFKPTTAAGASCKVQCSKEMAMCRGSSYSISTSIVP
jgi:hypothetical protein